MATQTGYKEERGTVRRGDGRLYDAIRRTTPHGVGVFAKRGMRADDSYYDVNRRIAETFEPERLHLSGGAL